MLARCIRTCDVPAAWLAAAAVQPAVGTSAALLHGAADAAQTSEADSPTSRAASGSGTSSSHATSLDSGWRCSCYGVPASWTLSMGSMALSLTRSMSSSTRYARSGSRHASRDDSSTSSASDSSSGGGSSRSSREQRGVLGGTAVPFRIPKRASVPAASNSRGWAVDQAQPAQSATAAVPQRQEGRAGAVTASELMARIQSTASLLDLEEVLADGSRSFTYKHLGAVASRVPPLVRASAGDLGAPRQLARLMAALEHLHVRAMHMLPARSIAHLLWAATKVQHRLSERTLLSCTQQLLSDNAVRLKEANGADLSLIAWGLAWQQMEAPAVWDALTEAAMAHMEQLAPQSLSTLATAFADADRFDQPLMEAIAGRSLALLPEFQPMQLVHLAWACRKLNYPDLQLFAGIQSAITPRLADINSRALGMLLSAYSHMHHPGVQELLLAAQPHVMRALSSMTPFTLNSVAAAYATAGCGSEGLWEALCAAAAKRVQAYRWAQLEMLLRVLRHRATPPLQDAVAAALQEALSSPETATAATPEDALAMQQVVARLAAVGHAEAAALQAAVEALQSQQRQNGAQNVAQHSDERSAAVTG